MNLPETLKEIPFKYHGGWHGEHEAERTYINDEFGIVISLVTPRRHGKWGKGKKLFSLKNGNRVFESYAELKASLNT